MGVEEPITDGSVWAWGPRILTAPDEGHESRKVEEEHEQPCLAEVRDAEHDTKHHTDDQKHKHARQKPPRATSEPSHAATPSDRRARRRVCARRRRHRRTATYPQRSATSHPPEGAQVTPS